MTVAIFVFIGVCLAFFFVPMAKSDLAKVKKLKPGKYTNKSGTKYYEVDERGSFRNTEKMGDFLNHPNVKRQIDAMHRLYMQQTLMALYKGKRPPHSAGGYGTLTKKKLIIEWNDDWQAELDKMSEYYDVTYNSFFDIPEEHPPVGIILTAEEILAEYGSEKES